MRKEKLRIFDLSLHTFPSGHLEHISLCLREGEVTAFAGTHFSGRDYLVRLLSAQEEVRLADERVWVDGRRVTENKIPDSRVYVMRPDNYRLLDWTVADYIGLRDGRWVLSEKNLKKSRDLVRKELYDLDIRIDAGTKLRALSEYERRLMDLAKACHRQAAVLIIDDDLVGMDMNEIAALRKDLVRITRGRMATIVNCNSGRISAALSDFVIFFRHGRITKKCSVESLLSLASSLEAGQGDWSVQIDHLILGCEERKQVRVMEQLSEGGDNEPGEPVYSVSCPAASGLPEMDWDFHGGEITCFITGDQNKKMYLFELLSGRKYPVKTTYWLKNAKGGRLFKAPTYACLVKNRLVSVEHLGSGEDLFFNLTVGQNLLLPSLSKISSADHILHAEQLDRYVSREDHEGLPDKRICEDTDMNRILTWTLERWLMYRPNAIVLMEPFARCDVYGVSLVRSYIYCFLKQGAAVVIISSRAEYIENMTDRFIFVDKI